MDAKVNADEDNEEDKIKDDNKAFVSEDTEFKDTISTSSSEKGSFPYDENRLNYNNNRHVVPAGLIIVLFTVYLTTAALQKCFVSTTEQMLENPTEFQEIHHKENERQQNILARFLEYPHVCKDLHIFVKEQDEEEWYDNNNEDSIEMTQETEADIQITGDNDGQNDDESNGNIINEKFSVENVNKITEKTRIQKQLKKRPNKKNAKIINGHKQINKNKSLKNKTNHKNNATTKKDQQQNKKSSTAEPIIYLFALVFIYLLLKAASDINQHYKSQNKGDKRLRRCSLQSYAQIHKQERRASKGITSKSLSKF